MNKGKVAVAFSHSYQQRNKKGRQNKKLQSEQKSLRMKRTGSDMLR